MGIQWSHGGVCLTLMSKENERILISVSFAVTLVLARCVS